MIVSEEEFKHRIGAILTPLQGRVKAVTGPGRSGAVAAVYASYFLGVPYIPQGGTIPNQLRPLLIIDTAMNTGRTMRKIDRKCGGSNICVVLYSEPPRIHFWYEY